MGKAEQWPELDLVRGLAGVVMVWNHAAAHWVGGDAATGLPWLMFTIGAYAPVLFFTTTGIGYGLQSRPRAPSEGHAFGFARKVVILLVADARLWLSPRTLIGNDFLGFIALTMLMLELLRGHRRGLPLALLGVGAIALTRFVLVPAVLVPPEAGEATLVHWLGGVASPPGFAYPPLPWLAYGLTGFAAGLLAQRHRDALLARRGVVLAVLSGLAALGLAFVLWRVHRGSVLARWGSVNGTFFVSGFAMILAASAAAFALPPGASRWLGLRGISSLALVPVHYGVIAVLGAILGAQVGSAAGFVVAAMLAVVAALVLARRWELAVGWLSGRAWAWPVLLACAALALLAQGVTADPAGRTAALVTGQLSLCALLIVRRPSR